MGDPMRVIRVTIVAAAIALFGCEGGTTYDVGGGGGGGGPGPNQVFMAGLQFVPSTRIVSSGAIVQWVNQDSVVHTVVLDSGPDSAFDSGNLAPGSSFSRHFGATGTYQYHCRIHGTPSSGMRGTLVVQ